MVTSKLQLTYEQKQARKIKDFKRWLYDTNE